MDRLAEAVLGSLMTLQIFFANVNLFTHNAGQLVDNCVGLHFAVDNSFLLGPGFSDQFDFLGFFRSSFSMHLTN